MTRPKLPLERDFVDGEISDYIGSSEIDADPDRRFKVADCRRLKHERHKCLYSNFVVGIFIRKMLQEQSFFLFQFYPKADEEKH